MGGVASGVTNAVSGAVGKGGGGAPPAPDYTSAANATAQNNLEMARLATRANRVNQYTPYGSLTYRETAPDTWEQRMELNPEAQQALNQNLEMNRKFAETANVGFDRVRSSLENPDLDMSQLPTRGINVGQTAQEAILSRLNPQLQQQEEALRTRLANQGITLGSDAYNKELSLAGQRENDLKMQAALQGINLDQANRAAALQEHAYLKDRPLNLINALRAGGQVANPQFSGFAQQGQTQGANLLGAAQANYGAQMDAYNAQQAANSNAMSGLFSLGLGVAGLGMPGGGTLGGKVLGGLLGGK